MKPELIFAVINVVALAVMWISISRSMARLRRLEARQAGLAWLADEPSEKTFSLVWVCTQVGRLALGLWWLVAKSWRKEEDSQ